MFLDLKTASMNPLFFGDHLTSFNNTPYYYCLTYLNKFGQTLENDLNKI